MKFEYAVGATPYSEDDRENLIPSHISLQKELDEWEYANILQAEQWAFARKRRDILTIGFIKLLHKNMFKHTWRWAGDFRKRQTNIGCSWYEIPSQIQLLLGDVKFWLGNNTYDLKEIAVRLHHRLVLIHPFNNGNGRMSRILADVLLFNYNLPRLTWGKASLLKNGSLRQTYIRALQKADHHNYTDLIEFTSN